MSADGDAPLDCTIQWQQIQGVTVLTLKGYLDAHSAPKLEPVFKTLLESKPAPLIIEGTHWLFVTPAGLNAFLTFMKKRESYNGDLALAHPTDLIRTIWCLSGFQALIPLYATLKQAVQVLNPSNRDPFPFAKHIFPHV